MEKRDYFELALLLAHAQAQQFDDEDKRWSAFIDNLRRICDEFAKALSVRRKEENREEKIVLHSSV